MVLHDRTSGRILSERVVRAESPWIRLVGWLHRAAIGVEEGIWFDGCDAVHTLGMRSEIDLIFVDVAGRVVTTNENVRPGRLIVSCPGAAAVLEMGPSFLWTHEVLSGESLIGHVLELEAPGDQATTNDVSERSSRRAPVPRLRRSSSR